MPKPDQSIKALASAAQDFRVCPPRQRLQADVIGAGVEVRAPTSAICSALP
jgi:hypothetical protein